MAFNDVDFCLKVRDAGYRNVWTPYAELYHHESVSRGYETRANGVSAFVARSLICRRNGVMRFIRIPSIRLT